MKDPLGQSTVNTRKVIFVTLLIVAAVTVWAIFQPKVVGTIALVLSVIVMIILHELGHFVMAKRGGMKVTEIFIGFGPKLWSVKRGETEYGVKAILIGGYVRIIGMHNLDAVEPEDEPRAYRNRPFRDRIGVVIAGSAVHFLIALVLIFVLLVTVGNPGDATAVPEVGEVFDDTPAQQAGFEPDDVVVAIDGRPVEEWMDIPDYVESRAGEEMTFTVERDGALVVLEVTPEAEAEDVDGKKVGRVGIANSGEIFPLETVSPLTATKDSFVIFGEFSKTSVEALGRIFSPSGIVDYVQTFARGGQDESGQQSQERFISPIGLGGLAGAAVDAGLGSVLVLLILINIFVGIFNMIPLLPFDGGHVAIAIYEKAASTIKRRPVHADVAKLLPLTSAVVFVLGFIFVTSVILDVTNPLQSPF